MITFAETGHELLVAEPRVNNEIKIGYGQVTMGRQKINTRVASSLDRYGRSLQDLISVSVELREWYRLHFARIPRLRRTRG